MGRQKNTTVEQDRLVFETWRSSGCPTYPNLIKIMLQKHGRKMSDFGVGSAITRHANRTGWGQPKTKRIA